MIFTNDVNSLPQQFGTEVTKTVALDLGHAEYVAERLSIN